MVSRRRFIDDVRCLVGTEWIGPRRGRRAFRESYDHGRPEHVQVSPCFGYTAKERLTANNVQEEGEAISLPDCGEQD